MPSPSGMAFERTIERSEPACDSVRHIDPVHSPEIILGTNFSWSSGLAAVRRASIAPSVSIGHKAKERLAE